MNGTFFARASAAAALIGALVCPGSGAYAATGGGTVQRIEFRRAVLNLESSVFDLKPTPRKGLRAPEAPSALHFGRIMRRLPGDDAHTATHYVDFCAEFEGGIAVRAWCDRNFNHDLTDDPPIQLSAHPRSAQTRSFLVDLGWTARLGWREHAIDQKIRVVLEQSDETGRMQARIQLVFGMLGSAGVGDREYRVVLFDGNGDGLYTEAFGDGLFIDLDSDGRLDIDPMAPEFVPIGVAVPVAGRRLQVASVDPEGRWLELSDLGEASERFAHVGQKAPELDALGVDGEAIRLANHRGHPVVLYFWASWCGNCAAQAPALHEIEKHASGARVLGISYDTDRADMERFRATYGETWPTTFSGRMLWEDPIGRLYGVDGPGVLCLITPDGVLEGIYENPADVLARLEEESIGVAGRWQNAGGTVKGGQR